jgi:hypothetical protein
MSHPNHALTDHTVPQATIWPAYAEPYGVAPAQYGPEHHHVAVPPPYAVAPPMYSAPAHDYGSRRRPGTVIAASVLAFIVGGLGALGSVLLLLAMIALSVSYHAKSLPVLLVIFCGILLLVVAHSALFIWGGIRVLKGRKTMLMVVSIIQVVFTVLGLLSDLAVRTTGPGTAVVQALLGLVFVGPILILLAHRSSREFFRARRGGTT